MSATAPLTPTAPSRLSATDLLLGTHPVIRKAILRWLLSAQSYVVALAMLFVGVHKGLASPMEAQLLTAYCALGLLSFYAVLRSGRTAGLKDPMLTFPQAVFSASAIVLSYGVSELSRSASLQLLFLLVVFEMQRLNQRQTNIITFGATAMLVGLLGYLASRGTPGFDLRKEIFNIALAGVMLPVLGMVAREVRRLRRKQMEQRGDLEKTLERLRDLSMRDPLTGLFNRRQLLSMLEEEAKRQARTGHAFAVAILDLDFFKRINDNFGHLVGDAVLRQFAQVGNSVLRTSDAFGRWGGEEFVVMLYDVNTDAAMQALERLRQAVAAHDWEAVAPGLKVSFSAGVCEHQPGADLTHTLERADRALYAAKGAGRDQARSAEPAA